MGSYSVTDLEKLSIPASPAATPVMDANTMQNMGWTNRVIYHPPQDNSNIIEGAEKGLAETPKLLGSTLQAFGGLIDPGATPEQQKTGARLGDRIYRTGIQMVENNNAFLAAHFPDKPNLWSKIGEGVGGGLPLAATLGVGALTGVDEALLVGGATAAVGGQTYVGALNALRDKNVKTLPASLEALIPAGAAGVLTAVGFGNFLKVAGPSLRQVGLSAANGAVTMLAQSAASGEIEHGMGINDGDWKERVSSYVINGVSGALLGGALGATFAAKQHAGLVDAYKELGLDSTTATKLADTTMAQGISKGLDILKSTVGSKAETEGRLKSIGGDGLPIDEHYPSVAEAPKSAEEVAAQSAGNKYVKLKSVDLTAKLDEKTTATDMREKYMGGHDEQILIISHLAEDLKTAAPKEQSAMYWAKEAESLGGSEFLKRAISDPEKVAEELQRANHKLSGIKEPFELDEKEAASYAERLKELRPKLEQALNLSEGAQSGMKEGALFYKESGEVGQALGTLREILEDYNARLWKPEKEGTYTGDKGRVGLPQSTPHAKERFYPTVFHGEAAGKRVATDDYADALTVHGNSMAAVNHSRQLADAISTMKPIRFGGWYQEGREPEGWTQVGSLKKDMPLQKNGEALLGDDNNQLWARYKFMAPEGIADGLKPLVDPDYFRSKIPGVATAQQIQGIAKTGLLSFSFFHHLTFLTQTMASMNGWKTLADFPKALQTNLMSGEYFRGQELDFVGHNGTTAATHAVQDILADLNKGDDPISKALRAPVAKQITDLSKASTDFLFGQMQRYIKVMTYAKNIADWTSKNPNATPEEVDAAKTGYAKAVNAQFGGLNWEALGIDKTRQSLLRTFLLAPDWVGSMLAATKYAATDWGSETMVAKMAQSMGVPANKFGAGTAGQLSRGTLFKAVVGGLVAGDLINVMVSGHHMWDNADGHHFEIEIAPNVYISPIRGAPGELIKCVADVIESGGAKGAARYAQGKMSPFMSSVVTAASGVNYYGGNIWKGENPVEQNVNGVWNIVSHMLPVPIGATGAVSYGTREEDQTPVGWAGVLTGLGRFSKSKQSDEEGESYTKTFRGGVQ